MIINNWTLSWDCFLQILKHSEKTFKKKNFITNVNLDDKKSQHSEKKCHKNVNLVHKKTQTSEKRHKNVTLSKKSHKLAKKDTKL